MKNNSAASNHLLTPSLIWSALLVICLLSAWILEQYWLAAIPAVALLAFVYVQDYRKLYLTFFVLLPFSVEVYLPGGLGTDLPSEPIMWLLTGLAFLLLIGRSRPDQRTEVWTHPITILATLHVLWIGISALTAEDTTKAFKFFFAKIWYVVPFYFLAVHLLTDRRFIVKIWKLTAGALLAAVVYVLLRHGMEGFSFKSANDVVQPIFRNHVNYACMLVMVLPYLVGLYHDKEVGKKKWQIFGIIALLIAIYFSFTRAAMLCVLIGIGAFFIIRKKWVMPSLITGTVVAVLGISYLAYDNQYLELAPDFEKTITHTKFENLVEATYKMEDISTMERLYRWVAAFEMIGDRPLMGFGPNNFYDNYTNYTISSFQTYVSDNPDRSGVHNYYLMTTADQGIVGLLLFLGLSFGGLIYGQRLYHRLKNPKDRWVVMAAIVSHAIILSFNLINDLLESDKIGPFFYLNLAVITSFAAIESQYASLQDESPS